MSAHDTSVRSLADRLIEAHRATVEWLTTVLAEHALGGPPALRATPTQVVAGGVTRAVNYPVRFARDQVNRAFGRVQRTGEQVRSGVTQVAGKAAQFSDNARDVLVTGRDASLERAEHVARAQGDAATARSVHETRAGLGALEASELPIAGYEKLGAAEAVQAIKQLTTVDALNTVVHYEEAHKNRSSAVSAAQTRHAALAQEVVGLR
ncbi:hypothetical protein GCM10023201_59540 [Actinomycetospora corticicola]|uniref:Uncharacterized protein n=1 Tax=Actinomycetospora corticicola TaxID=663602 RepID=A0A7Y9J914_9PSEU|nr:hypothetical protein [Actinomycetospora corticicola]NYD39681.1 hypothetical protein [Actinomycetospora corticicola]